MSLKLIRGRYLVSLKARKDEGNATLQITLSKNTREVSTKIRKREKVACFWIGVEKVLDAGGELSMVLGRCYVLRLYLCLPIRWGRLCRLGRQTPGRPQ